MTRSLAAWVVLLSWPLASAVAQPEPRTLTYTVIDLPAHRLLVQPDGSVDATVVWESPRRIEFVRLAKQGTVRKRVDLATGPQSGSDPRGPFPLASGGMAVLLDTRFGATGIGTLLRLGTDGDVVKIVPIFPPHFASTEDRRDAGFAFDLAFDLADGSTIVSGAYGPGPSSWWWARLAGNGARIAEMGAARWGIPNRVVAGRAEPDGGFSLVVGEINLSVHSVDLWLHRYDARGARTLHRKLIDHTEVHEATFNGDEIAIANGPDHSLWLFDAQGELKRRLSSNDQAAARLAADANGYLMIVNDDDEKAQIFLKRIERRDRNGVVLWRSARLDVVDAALAGDGSVWALFRTEDKVALGHYADP